VAGCVYDTDAIRAETTGRGAFANVPPRTMRKRNLAFSPWLRHQRHHIERFLSCIKQMRAPPSATAAARKVSSQPLSSPQRASGSIVAQIGDRSAEWGPFTFGRA